MAGHAAPIIQQHAFASPATLPGAEEPEFSFRPVNATDFAALKLLHAELFPVEYDDVFFHKTTRGLDGIVSWAALRPAAHLHRQLPMLTQLVGAPAAAAAAVGNGAAMPPSPRVMRASHVPVITGGQQLAGFITARFGTVAEVDAHHRHLLGLANSAVASQSVLYILTLGVVESCRQQGIATQLLRLLLDHAAGRQCRLVYLHVITYNHAAIRFYERMGFCSIATLQNFYIIRSESCRAQPGRSQYDACLFAIALPSSPDLQPRSSPLASLLGSAANCLPAAAAAWHGALLSCGSCSRLAVVSSYRLVGLHPQLGKLKQEEPGKGDEDGRPGDLEAGGAGPGGANGGSLLRNSEQPLGGPPHWLRGLFLRK